MKRYQQHPRILIVRLSAIGDTALTLPLLFGLRRCLPDAHIGWVVGETAAPLLEGLGQLSRLHVWRDQERNPLGLMRLAAELKREDYRLSIDPQGLAVSALLPYLAGIPRRVGFTRGLLESRELSWLLMNHRVCVPTRLKHLSERSLFLAQALELADPGMQPVELVRDAGSERRIQAWWQEQGLTPATLVFGIGTSRRNKIWPVAEMLHLVREARRWGNGVVITWGPGERDALVSWRGILGDRVIWAPATGLRELIALLRLARGYVGPDSAPLHLSWLLGKPTFSWFGPSDPQRCAPFGPGHAHVARGPHTWGRHRRHRGLEGLAAGEVLPEFRRWLSLAEN